MIGVPVKLMHEATSHFVTIEMKNGDSFSGYLIDSEVKLIYIRTQ